MLRRLVFAAVAAGLIGGLAISAVQEITTTPIILQAELFETAPAHDHPPGQSENAPAAAPWSPEEGIERSLYTALGNVVIGVGFALILVACFALHGHETDARRGVLWGLGGYAVFSLGPALGLPPEVPGSLAAELAARQAWWLLAATATAAGLALMVFGRGVVWVVLGIVLLAAPHFAGAPEPDRIGGAVPAELAGRFVAASLVTAAVFWALLGWLSGYFYRRLG